MAVNKNTYGLPDETLQLIAASPELNFGSAQQSGVPISSLIRALRGERSSNNPGVRLLANGANGVGLNFTRKSSGGSNKVPVLTMPKVPSVDVTLPGGEIDTPYVRPDTPVIPDLIYPDVIDPEDPVDPDPVDPDPEDPEVPEVPDPDPYDPTPDIIEDLPDPDPYDPSPDIIEDLPDPDPYDDSPVDLSGLTPELTDGSYWDDSTSPEPVGPTRGQPELPEEFDPYLVDAIMNLLSGGGAVGGGKPANDTYGNILEM